ncbi:hypothetical protein, partial [Alistipes ihumii]|uniref:hypothetical protein n=1 Tax=Alistipes ihumii TaxID=1470347 RepID=UPI0023576FBF
DRGAWKNLAPRGPRRRGALSADGLFSKPVTPSVDCADSFDATDIHPSRTIDTALLTIHSGPIIMRSKLSGS